MDRFIAHCADCSDGIYCDLKSNMDRFYSAEILNTINAEIIFKIQYGQIYRGTEQTTNELTRNLKSNMDRFIARKKRKKISAWCYLKSNMDRFIVPKASETEKYNKDLKSNMDRFIGAARY